MNYLIQSLEALEDRGVAENDVLLPQEVAELRKKQIGAYSIADLALMIAHAQGLAYLVPVALLNLLHTPFAEGDHFAGELLVSVLRIDHSFWPEHPDFVRTMDRLLKIVKVQIDEVDIADEIREVIWEAIVTYSNTYSC